MIIYKKNMKAQFLLPEECEKKNIKFNKIQIFDMILISRAINKVISNYCPKNLSRPLININIIEKAFQNIPYLEVESIKLINDKHYHMLKKYESISDTPETLKKLEEALETHFISLGCEFSFRKHIQLYVYYILKDLKLHNNNCHNCVLPFVLNFLREWIYCVNYNFPSFMLNGPTENIQSKNIANFDLMSTLKSTAKETIFDKLQCFKCNNGILDSCNYGCTDLICNNCNHIFEIKSNMLNNKIVNAGSIKFANEFINKQNDATLISITKNEINIYSASTIKIINNNIL
jgi:hypothetical protein